MNKIRSKIKDKIIWILLIVNSLLILLYVFSVGDTIDLFTKKETGAIGIIGGADGPTVIFVSSPINYYIIVLSILEITFITYLLLTHFRNKRIGV